MKMLENVTVIIPAHNRPERLQRLLEYYSSTDIRIIVPDSSTEKFMGKIPRPENTVYIHRPGLHMLLKVREILPMIETPYVLYCADDDFAVPSGIKKVTEFLDLHPDFSLAQGHYLTFTPRKHTVEFLPRYIRYFDKQVCAPTPLERLEQETSMYASLLYGVARTDAFRKVYSYCFDSKGELRFKNLFLAEEYFNHAMLICGNYATVACFFSARERIEGSATDTTVPISVVKTADEYKDEYEGFIISLTNLLADMQPMAKEEAREEILKISRAQRDTASISLKRRIVTYLSRHRLMRPLSRIADRRYAAKGLKAVEGMPSYPCTFDTPEKQAILKAIQQDI